MDDEFVFISSPDIHPVNYKRGITPPPCFLLDSKISPLRSSGEIEPKIITPEKFMSSVLTEPDVIKSLVNPPSPVLPLPQVNQQFKLDAYIRDREYLLHRLVMSIHQEIEPENITKFKLCYDPSYNVFYLWCDDIIISQDIIYYQQRAIFHLESNDLFSLNLYLPPELNGICPNAGQMVNFLNLMMSIMQILVEQFDVMSQSTN